MSANNKNSSESQLYVNCNFNNEYTENVKTELLKQFEQNTYLLGRIFSTDSLSEDSDSSSGDEMDEKVKELCSKENLKQEEVAKISSELQTALKPKIEKGDSTAVLLQESLNEVEQEAEDSEFSLFKFKSKCTHFKDTIQKLRSLKQKDAEIHEIVKRERKLGNLSKAFEQVYAFSTGGELDLSLPYEQDSKFITKSL